MKHYSHGGEGGGPSLSPVGGRSPNVYDHEQVDTMSANRESHSKLLNSTIRCVLPRTKPLQGQLLCLALGFLGAEGSAFEAVLIRTKIKPCLELFSGTSQITLTKWPGLP